MLSLFRKPKIYFVVIAYNSESYIKECLDSILSQNIDKEIICIDDCSTDNTYNILQQYKKEHKEIKLFQNEQNSGTVITRCNGLMHCKGEYMLFVDADDKLLSNSMERIYLEAKTQDLDMLEFSSNTDSDYEHFAKALQRSKQLITDNIIDAYQEKKISNQLWNKLVSESVYKKVVKKLNTEIKQANFSDVVYFMYHFLLNCKRFGSTDIVGYFYYDKRGMTANISDIDRLRQFCNFKITKNELERVYGKIPALKITWNYVCNQAVSTYLDLPKDEQEKHKYLLNNLMSEKNSDFLIKEIKKIKSREQNM